jgi:hypothetical protein
MPGLGVGIGIGRSGYVTGKAAAINTLRSLSPVALYLPGTENYVVDAGNAEAGDQVSSWLDSSGNGYHATQATADDQPTIGVTAGGDYYLGFNAADGTLGDLLSCTAMAPALANKTGMTMVVAFRAINTEFGWIIRLTGSGGFARSVPTRCTLAGGTTIGGATSAGNDYVDTVVFDGTQTGRTTSEQNRNRLIHYRGTAVVTSGDADTIGTTTGGITDVAFGRWSLAPEYPGDFYVYAAIIFNRAITSAELLSVDNALKTLLAFY